MHAANLLNFLNILWVSFMIMIAMHILQNLNNLLRIPQLASGQANIQIRLDTSVSDSKSKYSYDDHNNTKINIY